MGLSSGDLIGPYEVQRELGRGGMGEVYLARDSRLDRLVAIKAVPDHLATDPDRLARFQREAMVLASLSHPNIGAIYGLEESAARPHLVLEFVEGKTLADRLNGPVPVPEALAIAAQIADALEAAHEKGVIHRDLKPGNVMITPDGTVKVLDFGIARMPEPAAFPTPISPQAPTSPAPARVHSPTIPGAIMGSPGYMSPEQSLGKDVDKRSDIFAFGCVLFEMLTGVQVFPGENPTASIAAVLHLEPDWSRLPAETPVRVRELLAAALSKDKKQRLHDIGDARLALDQAIQGREWITTDSDGGKRRRPLMHALPWVIAAIFLVAAIGVSWPSWANPGSDRTSTHSAPIHLRVDVPEATPNSITSTCSVAISADGRQIAYVSYEKGRDASIIVRRLDDSRIQRLRFSDVDPFVVPIAMDIVFSPDGRLIAGFQQSSLFVVSVAGGEPVRLYSGTSNVSPKGAAWTKDGILFAPAANTGLLLISERGGDPQTITVPDPARDEISHRYPDPLPDGRHVLMTVKKAGILTFDDAEIALLDLQTRTWKTILKGGSFARYVPSGHIVFIRNGSIMAVPFDADSRQVTGSPSAVLSGVVTSPSGGTGGFAVARDRGTLIYLPGGIDDIKTDLVWIALDGTIEPVGAPIMQYATFALSPDGTRIASGVWGANDAIFVYDLARQTNTRITYRGNSGSPMWLPDGSRIVYTSDIDGPLTYYLCNSDGSGKPEAIGGHTALAPGSVVTLDGKPGLVIGSEGDIWFTPIADEPRRRLFGSQFDETLPSVSPDGRWLSYASNESGQYEVYIRPFPAGEGRWQASVGGGWFSCWMPDGNSLVYFRDTDRAVFRVPIRSAPSLQIEAPEPLFILAKELSGLFQPTPDGARLLSIREVQSRITLTQVNLVLNWFDELRARVPTGSK